MKAGVNAKVVEAFDINDKANDVYEYNFGHRPYQVWAWVLYSVVLLNSECVGILVLVNLSFCGDFLIEKLKKWILSIAHFANNCHMGIKLLKQESWSCYSELLWCFITWEALKRVSVHFLLFQYGLWVPQSWSLGDWFTVCVCAWLFGNWHLSCSEF